MERHTPRKYTFLFIVLFLLASILFLADIFFGSLTIPVRDVWAALNGDAAVPHAVEQIILYFRIPKAIVAVLVGVSLAISGLQMQTVFRNPLADPYVLGISSGAGLGVALFVLGMGFWSATGAAVWIKNFGVAAAGWAGAMIILGFILVVSVRLRNTMTILIFGIMIGGAASAVIGLLQYVSAASALKTYVLWTMGSFSNVSPPQLSLLTLSVLAGLLLAILSAKNLNVLQAGDTYAQSIGMNVRRARSMIFISAGLLTGSVTAFCGPIGFIGIAVPHVARMLFRNANHGVLIPASILIGACTMLLCDILSQWPGSEHVLPINTITALMGIPVILLIIFRNQNG
ncbi:MAG: iron ABC transporter permease [Prevotellaceae bacterium]|jgi:iron complex transport system permease protein|nr:iron ABC transporter permease [Prevotellaceae bacterium]